MKNILVVAAHPDDEVLGCGGTILRHIEDGDSVHLVFMADGEMSRDSANSNDVKRRKSAVIKAKNILGISTIEHLGFSDNQMDSHSLLVITQALEKIISKVRPIVIYTHHHGDLNLDHRLTYQSVMTACRPLPEFCVKEIYGFEILSSSEWSLDSSLPFSPRLFVDISKQLQTKIDAINAYSAEMRLPPHPRSITNIEVLAQYRGYSVGTVAAEAFEVYRLIR
jgi:LmbE family N-acetylglucosaminyl deacetylase